MIEQLRELHQPVVHYSYATCEGCDYGGYEAESPEWPCRTADLLYSKEEIADTLDAIKQAAEYRRGMEQRNRSLAPRRQSLTQMIYSDLIEAQLKALPLFNSLTVADPYEGKTVTFTRHSNALVVSRQLMEDTSE